MSIGRRVAQLRIGQGESLREAAIRTGVSHSTIARIEKGEVTGSYHDTLRKIAEGYLVPLEYLLTGQHARRPSPAATLRNLSPEERASLLFTPGPDRIRRAVALVTGHRQGILTREQFAAALGIDLPTLEQVTDGRAPLPGDLAERLLEQLALLTGLSPLWFRWSLAERAVEVPTSPEWSSYIRLVEKSSRAEIHPELLEMAIDLLRINGDPPLPTG